MVIMAFLLGRQELRVSIKTDLRCQYSMTSLILVPGVAHKPQGDPKPEVLSLHGTLLPKIAAPLETRHQGECKKKRRT